MPPCFIRSKFLLVDPSSAPSAPLSRQQTPTSSSFSAPAPNPVLPPRTFRKTVELLLAQISTHRSSSVFQTAIRDSDAPLYGSVVRRPLDLRTIGKRVKEGEVQTIDELERDVLLMFTNALLFNPRGSEVYRMAEEVSRRSVAYPSRSTRLDSFFLSLTDAR